MKKLLMDRILLIFTVLFCILLIYLGYLIINRVNAKRTIKKDVYEILNDYQIGKSTKKFNIIIHSKSNYSTKISYNVMFRNDKYDDLDYEYKKDIIKYIKKISFKGNNKKYFINKVVIFSKKNKYEYNKLFKLNDKLYGVGVGEIDSNSATDTIKDKWEEIKERFSD